MLRLFLVSALALLSLSAMSANRVTFPSPQGHPEEVVSLDVTMENSQEITALQVTISLPESMDYVEGSLSVNPERVTGQHTLTTSCSNRLLKIFIYSTSLQPLSGSSGTLFSFQLRLGKEPGTYPLTAEWIASDKKSNPVAFTLTEGSVTILSPKLDLPQNADWGTLPVGSPKTQKITLKNVGNELLDITSISFSDSAFTADKSSLTLAPGASQTLTVTFLPDHAGDIEGLMTVCSNSVTGPQTVSLTGKAFSVNELHISSASGKSGDEVEIALRLNNMSEIVALQCSFALPPALSYVEGSARISARGDGHQISTSFQNNILSLYLYSLSNTTLSGQEGDILFFKLALTGESGTYPLTPYDVILTGTGDKDVTSAVYPGGVSIQSPKISLPDSLYFGNIPLEKVAQKRLLIRNDGEVELTVSKVSFLDDAAVSTTEIPFTIVPKGQQELSIEYTPQQKGPFATTLLLYSNDPENPMKTVRLSGNVFISNFLTLETESATGNILFSLTNGSPLTALQFDIHLPNGVSLSSQGIHLTERCPNHQGNLSALGGDLYRFFLHSPDNQLFIGNDGVLFSAGFTFADSIRFLQDSVRIDNIILSDIDGQDRASEKTASCSLSKKLAGDANGDGTVSVTDVVSIINYILERPVSPFVFAQADVNGDGEITIGDATRVISLILESKQ